MIVFLSSFLAGMLTVAAPCILPVLPIILGSGGQINETSKRNTLLPRSSVIIITSLLFTVLIMTLFVKSFTLFTISSEILKIISGSVLVVLGAVYLFPLLWRKIGTHITVVSTKIMKKGLTSKDGIKEMCTGISLGLVFNSCSPTYLYLVAVILPAQFISGFIYIIGYLLGLGASLTLIALFGKKTRFLFEKLGNKTFMRIMGCLLVVVGIFILVGIDKEFQTWIIENGWYAPVEKIEDAVTRL